MKQIASSEEKMISTSEHTAKVWLHQLHHAPLHILWSQRDRKILAGGHQTKNNQIHHKKISSKKKTHAVSQEEVEAQKDFQPQQITTAVIREVIIFNWTMTKSE